MKKKFISLLIMALGVVSLSSCLKDEYLYDIDDQKPVIEFEIASGNLTTLTVSDETTSKDFWVNYSISYAQDITEDITVTVGIDESLLSDGETLLPAGCYTLSTESYAKTAEGLSLPMELVIPAYSKQDLTVRTSWNNRRNAQGTLHVNAAAVEAGTYYLPLRITAVSPQVAPISGNFGHEIICVVIK